MLADNKADLNQPNKKGVTPACMSAQNGHADCLQVLTDNKADLNQPAKNGFTPATMPAQCAYPGHTVLITLGSWWGLRLPTVLVPAQVPRIEPSFLTNVPQPT